MLVTGGLAAMDIGLMQRITFACMIGFVLLSMLLFGIACAENQQPPPEAKTSDPGKVLDIAFNTVAVSNLERSMKFYRMLGFTPVGETDRRWIEDEALNRLYRTPGAKSRTAELAMATTDSGRRFTLYLREFDGVERGGRVDFPARNPSSSHIGVMVPEADALWEELRSAELLRPLSWEGKLIRMPGQTSGGLAYVRDPDGYNVEIIGVRQQSSNASDPEYHPTFGHIGLVILDYDKSRSFYGDLLGARFPEALGEWVSGDNYDAVVGGRGYVIRLINGMFPEAGFPQASMPFELVLYQNPSRDQVDDYSYSDVAVNCVGFQVAGLDSFYAKLKKAGIETWSEGGIVELADNTRAVVMRDPDVGAFVELFEKTE
jgi:catechol 2,3-dioxygenase-like lactoylglutathione lyase family enzyme